MRERLGSQSWFIPDCYIPPLSTGELESHESICVLNCNDQEAQLWITVYFEDDPPIEKVHFSIAGKRTKHIRTSSILKGNERIPSGVPYAAQIESDIPIVVQYSRLDSTQAANALMSTMAFPL